MTTHFSQGNIVNYKASELEKTRLMFEIKHRGGRNRHNKFTLHNSKHADFFKPFAKNDSILCEKDI